MLEEPLMNPTTKRLVDSLIKSPIGSVGFSGPEGSGKFRLAKYLCLKMLSVEPGQFDFKVEVIDCRDKSGIDDIRSLKSALAIKSAGDRTFNRAVIFDNFHKISVPAQNSILKLLEEPPLDTVIIILVDTKGSILPTIVSRLQWVDVLPLGLDLLREKYKDYDDNSIKQAYLLSDGYLASFEKMLNEENNSLKIAIADAKRILKLKKVERIAGVDKILDNREYSLEEFLGALQKIYLILVRKEADGDKHLRQKALSGLDKIIQTKESLKYNANSKLILTDLLYKI